MTKKLKSPLSVVLLLVLPTLVYLKTLPPSLTWEHFASDGGELIATVYTWGIPHPPGTPLYVLLGQPWRYLPFVTDPAQKFNLMSTFFALGTLLVAYKIVSEQLSACFLAFLTIPFLAFGTTFWSQAIVAEVLSLNVFLISFLTLLLWRWHQQPQKTKYLYGAFFIYGLTLTNHTSSLCFLPAIIYLVGVTNHRQLTEVKRVAKLALLILLGLAPYLYLLIRAQSNPPLNWGDPSTLIRFFNHITAKEYQQFLFFRNQRLVVDNFYRALRVFWENFNPLGTALIFLGLFATPSTRFRNFLLFAILFQVVVNSNYNIYNIETFYLPSLLFLNLILGLGLKEAWAIVLKLAGKIRLRQHLLFFSLDVGQLLGRGTKKIEYSQHQAFLGLSALVILGAGFYNVFFNWEKVNLSQDREADQFGRQTFAVLEPGAIVVTGTDRYTLGLMYHRYVVFPDREDVVLVSNGTFLKNYWQVDTLRRHFPQLKYPEITPETMPQKEAEAKEKLLEFIALNLPEHPIYLAEVYPPFDPNFTVRSVFEDKYVVESQGPVYKIVGEEED